MARLFGQQKSATIQHYVNPAILPTYEVRIKLDERLCVVSGQVLFFDMDGLAVQKRQACFCGVYDQNDGNLIVLVQMPAVERIVKQVILP